jgi:hypothetical protein
VTPGAVRKATPLGVFSYRLIRTVMGLSFVLVGSVAVMVVVFSPRAHGSALAGALLFLVGVWGVFYVSRRIAGPWRVEIQEGEVRATFWKGVTRSWALAELSVRPRDLGSFWDGSAIVVRSSDNRIAFRVFRDLVGFRSLCEIITRGAA